MSMEAAFLIRSMWDIILSNKIKGKQFVPLFIFQ